MNHQVLHYKEAFVKLCFIISLLLLCSQSSRAHAIAQEVANYSRWSYLPTTQLMTMGKGYTTVKNKPDSALLCYTIVANRYYEKKLKDEELSQSIKAMAQLSTLYINNFYDYAKAYFYCIQAQSLIKKHGCDDLLPQVLLNMAIIKSYQHNLERASAQGIDKAVLYAFKMSFHSAVKYKQWNIANAAFIDMMIETAFQGQASLIAKESAIVKLKIPRCASTPWLDYDKAMIDGVNAYDKGNYDEALAHFNTMLAKVKSNLPPNRVSSESLARNFLCMVYEKTHRYDQLIAELHNNERLARSKHVNVILCDAYQNLYCTYETLNKPDSAAKYKLLWLQVKADLEKNNKLNKIDETQFLYDLQIKNQQVREAAIINQMHQYIIGAISTFSLIIIILLIIVVKKYRQVNEQNRYLYERMQALLDNNSESAQQDALQITPKAKYSHSTLDEDAKSELQQHILEVMQNSAEVYSENFNLEMLAQMVNSNRTNVSQAVNEKFANFKQMLIEYRIKEACRRMNNVAAYGNYTVEGIAQSVGFKSRTNFAANFRRVTGLTPSSYQHMAKNKRK